MPAERLPEWHELPVRNGAVEEASTRQTEAVTDEEVMREHTRHPFAGVSVATGYAPVPPPVEKRLSAFTCKEMKAYLLSKGGLLMHALVL